MFKLDFGDAIYFAKAGMKVSRDIWDEDFVWLQEVDAPYMGNYLEKREDGVYFPYTPTQDDMLADDWDVVE